MRGGRRPRTIRRAAFLAHLFSGTAFAAAGEAPLLPSVGETVVLCPLAERTDMGFTYEAHGAVQILFGDTWNELGLCPIRANDDALASLSVPADWPGFVATARLADAQCPVLSFASDARGARAPIELVRWDGKPIPLGPLATPVGAFFDGEREWAFFLAGELGRCPVFGGPCGTNLDPRARLFGCGWTPFGRACIDSTSAQQTNEGRAALHMHIAERTGPTSYVSRYAWLTNKFVNPSVRAVRSFDPADLARSDYRPGAGALLIWGRPGFDAKGESGEAAAYLAFHPLPFEIAEGRIAFRPRFFRDPGPSGTPIFSEHEPDARPLYAGEIDPVVHATVSYVAPLGRFVMLYGGDLPWVLNRDGDDLAHAPPTPAAIHVRFAETPWGPWTGPTTVLAPADIAGDLVCSPDERPAGCLPRPSPRTRPLCLEWVDRDGRGRLYGANVIDAWTRDASYPARGTRAADIYWNVSTWHPYRVLLLKTRLAVEPAHHASRGESAQQRGRPEHP